MSLLTGAAVGVWPARAQAQHVGVSIGIGFGYGYGFYNPWWGYPYGPYAAPYPAVGAYPYYGYEATAVRLQATPRNAEVFVDGYRAGVVDDFDGTFQRLSLPPGQHEVTVYLAGYRTWSQSIQANPGTSQKFQFAMEPLKPGEANEPRPVPAPPQERPYGQDRPMRMMPPVQIPGGVSSSATPPGNIDVAPAPMPTAPPAPPTPPAPSDPATAGSISIHVQPGGAEVFVDGQHWGSLGGGDKLVIRVAEGQHRIDVGKAGYVPFTADVEVKRGEVTPVTVSLKK